MDVWAIKEVVLDQVYQAHRPVIAGDCLIDIGAGIGDFCISSSQKAGLVYAYEIDPNRLKLLSKNIEINQISNINIIRQKAPSIDNILSTNNIDVCHFLKIDCEGCEYDLFQHSSQQSLAKIGYIAAEIHLFNPAMHQAYADLSAKLASNKFHLIEVANPVHSYIRYLYATNTKFAAHKTHQTSKLNLP